MTESQTKKALWTPAWYALDQTLIVGHNDRFHFFQSLPLEASKYGDDIDFVFFNQLANLNISQIRLATISRIWHQELGDVQKIETTGLDYVVTFSDENEVIINAEEEPGSTYDEIEVKDWTVFVDLENVSEPIIDAG